VECPDNFIYFFFPVGTARLKEIIEAEKVNLTREEWYRLYLAAGHILP